MAWISNFKSMEVSRYSKSNLFYQGIILFTFITPISQFLSIRWLIILACFSVFIRSNDRALSILKNAWDIILFLFILAAGMISTNDLHAGWRVMETNFSLFAIPIVFSAITWQKEWLYRFLKSFTLGLLVACMISAGAAIDHYMKTHSTDVFFFYNLTAPVGMQPTYFAYYLCLSISFLLFELYGNEVGSKPYVVTIVIIFLFIMLMLTGARTAYISMLLIFSYFILKYFTDGATGMRKRLSLIVSVLLMFFMLFINYFDFNAGSFSLDNSDYWERITLWKSAIDANPNLFFGVGTGDYQSVLNDYYKLHKMDDYLQESLNSHNQFIHSYISNGMIGLLAIMVLIGRPLYLSFRNQNVLGILVFFPFLIYGINEVFLGRYQGVVFFGLLHQLFISYDNNLRPTISLKPS